MITQLVVCWNIIVTRNIIRVICAWCWSQPTQKNNFTRNLAWNLIANTPMFFTMEEIKGTVLDFWQETVGVL